MAPLTWRNVDAPDLSKASQILNQSATMLGGATDGLGENLFDIRDRQRRDRSAAVLPEFAKVANEQGVAGALAKMGSMINPNDMTPELQQAMLNLRGNTLDYESSRATTALNQGNNTRAQGNYDLSMRQHADLSRLTGAAARLREDATGLYGNGQQGGAAPSAGGPLNDREILARTIMAEAGGEGYNGMLGVGAVIANRARAGRFGNSVRDVIMAPGQFSAWNSVTGYAKGQGGLDMNNMRASEDAYRAADAILSGQYEDITGGATHYYNDKVATPKWGTQAGGNWGRIGNHVFGVPAGEQGVPSNAPTFSTGSPGAAPAAPVTGNAARELQRLSDLIGPDTSLTPDQVLGLIDGNQTAAITAEDQTFKREEKDVERAERARTLQQERIQREALAFAQEARGRLGPDVQDAVNEIYDMEGISPQEKDARIAAVRKFYTDNASNYDLNANVAVPEQVNAGLNSVRDNANYLQTTDPIARLAQAADRTDDARTPVNVVADINEALGEDINVAVPDFLNVINQAADKYGLDPNMVARVAENMIVGGGFFGADVKLDRSGLMARLEQTFGDGEAFSNARNMVRTSQSYLDEADKLQNKVVELEQRRQYWAEPGRDQATAEKNFERINGQLEEAKKALLDLNRRAGNERRSYDVSRGRASPEQGPGSTTAAQSVDEAFQKVLQGEGSIEDVLITAVEAGDPDAIAQVKASLIEQGVDPRVAENSTELKKLVKQGAVDLLQGADSAVGDASAFTGRLLEMLGRGGAYAYGTVDPQGASRALQMLDSFGGSMDRLAEEGYIADKPGPRVTNQASEATRSEGNNEAGVTYAQWRKMTRAERKRAGLPDGELEGQFYFSRFGEGFR